MSNHESGGQDRIIVWDLPTRVFHWLLVASYAGAWLTFDDNRYLYAHVFAGYTFFGLLIFRLLWGMVGSRYARFRAFAFDWPSVWAYLYALLTGKAARYIGHNPVGSWVIFLIIGFGIVVSLAGMFTLGGEEQHGPLKGVLIFAAGTDIKEIHEGAAWLMLALTAIHVAGVIIESLLHRENLVLAMITGYKVGRKGDAADSPYAIVGIILALVVAGFGLIYFKGYLAAAPDMPFVPFQGPALPDNVTWRKACGECHLAYHPTLLPARSWQKLMADQSNHFGDDLALDEATTNEITAFLVKNASESQLSEPAWKISSTTPQDQTPLRITDTPYWKKKHGGIPENIWNLPKVKEKGNCGACHLDAEQGTFEDSGMRLPKALQ